MEKRRREQKAELMREAEEIIDRLLDWGEETGEPNMSQIEEIVLELRERLSERMAEAVVRGQEKVRPVPGPSCPGCEKEMRYKGMQHKTISSWVGEVEMDRGYYYCDHCGRGLFPPG